MKYVSAGKYTENYHTNLDCPYLPKDIREVREDDLRREMNLCLWCDQNE